MESMSIEINGEPLEYKLIGRYFKMIPLGKFEVGDNVKLELKCKKDKFKVVGYIYYENEEILKKHYESLSKEQVDLKEISGREYEGKIKIESENEYVLFSIPYDKGWKVKVNGNNADALEVRKWIYAC